MKLYELLLICFLLIFSVTQTGCASFNKKLKGWLGGNEASQQAEQSKQVSTTAKFSDGGDVSPRVKRQYKRTTKESLSEESALDSKAGSLWVMEGQGAYLFSQNVVRLVGDPLAVTLEGDPKDQLQSKANVIKKLLAKIEERQKARLRSPTSESGEAAAADESSDKDKDTKTADANNKGKKDKNNPQNQNQQAPTEQAADLSVKIVPTRIVERTLEGNYRVKGTQPFMIGPREFKIIVTGIVRAEDFNEEGISATKLLDPKFDIVSARKTETQL
jgi:flagellar L-ring protein precursor FlgH